MRNWLFNKTIICGIIILFIVASFAPSITGIEIKSMNLSDPNEKPKLKIEDFKGGIGLTFLVKNEGEVYISDITLDMENTGKYLIIKSEKHIEIPFLQAGESIEIKIELFGFGYDEPLDLSRIIITANAPSINSMKRIVPVGVIGNLVTVVAVNHNDEGSFDGYTLFAPGLSFFTYLIDKDGNVYRSWMSNHLQGRGVHLTENGDIFRTCVSKINPIFTAGGFGGHIEMFSWNGTLLWEFEYSNDQHCIHHGIEVMPNGNILLIAWERKTAAEAIAAGRNPFTVPAGVLWPSYIIEVEPIYPKGGNIVWEWHVWDHLIQDYDSTKDNYGDVGNHPELIDINCGLPTGIVDINHINSLDYNAEFDQILLSAHVQNEIWIIDHSTTTEEAAGHTNGTYGKGGDLLYRWGNPQNYHAGGPDDQIFYGQHDARWIESGCPGEGHITVFNNGFLRPGLPLHSSVDEVEPPVDSNGNYYLEHGSAYGPKEPVWRYTAENPSDFFGLIQSGAQRLPNGNTLICVGPSGTFFEVTYDTEIVWKYVNLYPDLFNTDVFKINLYPLDYLDLGHSIEQVNKVTETRQTPNSNAIDRDWTYLNWAFLRLRQILGMLRIN